MKNKGKLLESSDHLHYEIWMLRMLAYKILQYQFGEEDPSINQFVKRTKQGVTHTSSPQVYSYSTDSPFSPPSNDENDLVVGNALLESFTIHLRSLINFFYSDSAYAKSDDILAEHYFSEKEYWGTIRPFHSKEELRKIKTRVSKEIAHLTYTRNKTSTIPNDWPIFQY
jgi:hypothetical protein